MIFTNESFLVRWFLWLRGAYLDSGLYRRANALGEWVYTQCRESRILSLFRRESALTAQWDQSRVCAGLSAALGWPAYLLHRWYQAWRPTFEGSFFARLLFTAGDNTATAQSVLIALLWLIPYERWNNAYTLEVFVFLLLLFHAGSMRREKFRPDAADIGFYPFAFFMIIVLAAPFSYRADLSWRFLWYHIPAALGVLVTVSAVRNVADLKHLCAGTSVCVLMSSLYAFGQRLSGLSVNLSYVDLKLNPDMPARVYSYFDNPNTFAEVLIILLPLTLALALCSARRTAKITAWGIWVIGVVALAMTYSRAAWVGFALSVVVTVLLMRPALMIPLILFCIAAIPLLPSAIWTRIVNIFNLADTTTSSRFPAYEAALEVIRRLPLDGVGLGTEVVKQYIRDNRLYHGASPFVHAHNLYLEMWMETGLVGVGLLLAALVGTLRHGFQILADAAHSPARVITVCAAAGVCGIALCGVADYPWHYPRVMVMFWYLFAVLLAGIKICRAEPSDTVESGIRNPRTNP